MAEWSVKPSWKKSIIERNYLVKDGQTFMVETGWRWGEFLVYTDDDNPPKIEAGVDIYNCDYETELIETTDGCWEEYDYDDVDDETREWLEEFFDEGNSWLDLEEHGWSQDECEMIIDCDLEIRKLNEDGTCGELVETNQEEDADTEQALPKTGAVWPFTNASSEETELAEFTCEDCGYSTEDINDLVDNPNDDDKGAYVCPECGGRVNLG
jgi:hypothetical protein